MQQVWVGTGPRAQALALPDPEEEVIPGVGWGHGADPSSPAYWAARCHWPDDALPNFETRDGSILEEVGFCLLGGHGVTYEMAAAAFGRLQAHEVFDTHKPCDECYVRDLLIKPLDVSGRSVRYRFPNQRARRIIQARNEIGRVSFDGLKPLEMRSRLQLLEGIGPKTASWIVRNLFGSDDVAILDVHVMRACRKMSLFSGSAALPRDYMQLERRFLEFAKGIGIRASVLDAVMWAEVRKGAAASSS